MKHMARVISALALVASFIIAISFGHIYGMIAMASVCLIYSIIEGSQR